MKKFIFLLSTVFVFLSCEKEYYIPDDPQEAILGKWRLIEYKDFSDNTYKSNNPDLILEFLSDGVYIIHGRYSVEAQGILARREAYRIDSLYLYTNTTKEQLLANERNYIEIYKFYKDKLQLNYYRGFINLSMGTPCEFVYQRIK